VNIFNRIIMIIAMLCLAVFSIVAIVNIFADLFEWSEISSRIINYANSLNRYALAAILFLVFVIAVIILIFEFRRKKANVASIFADSTGKTMVTIKTSEAQIKDNLNNIEGVINPQVKVVPGQNGVIINIFSKLAEGINIAEKTKEIRETATGFASKNLGLKVLETNYTATGFVAATEKMKREKEGKEQEQPDTSHE
jgi:hypothetical protein